MDKKYLTPRLRFSPDGIAYTLPEEVVKSKKFEIQLSQVRKLRLMKEQRDK